MQRMILGFILVMSPMAFANDETRAGVEQVQKEMQQPGFHQDAAKDSKQAKEIEDQVKALSGNPQNEQEMYNLAAEVLGNMKDKSPDEMMKMLQEAQKNPEGFANKWTPEQKKKLKDLSERIPAGQKRNP